MRYTLAVACCALIASGCAAAEPTPEVPSASPELPPAEAALPDALLLTWKPGGGELLPVYLDGADPAVGADPIPMGMYAVRAVAPGGASLAAWIDPKNDSLGDGSLTWIDLARWESRPSSFELDEGVMAMAFSPEGSTLAIATWEYGVFEGELKDRFLLRLVDVENDSLVAETALEVVPQKLTFGADGSQLIVYGTPRTSYEPPTPTGPPSVLFYKGHSLQPDGAILLEDVVDGILMTPDEEAAISWEMWTPAVVFSADMGSLYVVHADQDVLTTVDLTDRAVSSVEIAPPRTWLERILALGVELAQAKGAGGTLRIGQASPDGTRLFILTTSTRLTGTTVEVLEQALQVVETNGGALTAEIPTEATDLSLALDGRRLLLRGYTPNTSFEWTEVWDVDTLRQIERFDRDGLEYAVGSDGRWYEVTLGANRSRVALRDLQAGEVVAEWQFPRGWIEVIPLP
jgi:hypothetical protein